MLVYLCVWWSLASGRRDKLFMWVMRVQLIRHMATWEAWRIYHVTAWWWNHLGEFCTLFELCAHKCGIRQLLRAMCVHRANFNKFLCGEMIQMIEEQQTYWYWRNHVIYRFPNVKLSTFDELCVRSTEYWCYTGIPIESRGKESANTCF